MWYSKFDINARTRPSTSLSHCGHYMVLVCSQRGFKSDQEEFVNFQTSNLVIFQTLLVYVVLPWVCRLRSSFYDRRCHLCVWLLAYSIWSGHIDTAALEQLHNLCGAKLRDLREWASYKIQITTVLLCFHIAS